MHVHSKTFGPINFWSSLIASGSNWEYIYQPFFLLILNTISTFGLIVSALSSFALNVNALSTVGPIRTGLSTFGVGL